MLLSCIWVLGQAMGHGQPNRGNNPKINQTFVPSYSRHWPVTPQPGMRPPELLLYPSWKINWLDLFQVSCEQPQLLCFQEFSVSVMEDIV